MVLLGGGDSRMNPDTKRRLFWAILGLVVVAALLAQAGDESTVPPARSYTSAECEAAEIAYNASVMAIDRMEAEGLSDLSRDRFGSEAAFRGFHNDIIIEQLDILEDCGL